MKNGGGFTTVAILMSVLTSATVSRAERMRQGRLKVTEVNCSYKHLIHNN